MRLMRWGLAAALCAAVLAPAAVISAPKAPAAAVSDAQRKQGMAEAPAVAQSLGLGCQVSDARFVGKGTDAKTKTETSYYEVACGQGMGYVLVAPKGGQAMALSCLETAPQPGQKEASLACVLPANSDPKAALGPLLQKSGVACTPDKARALGQTKSNTILEVACQGGAGYILIASAPLDPAKPVEAQNCNAFDDGNGNIKCELTDKATRLALVDRLAQSANNGCVVKDRRFVGTVQDGSDFYEAACQDGKGYLFKAKGGQFSQAYGCAQAQNILGGCTLTDARQASAEQAALYTKLARNAGSNCDVDHYAVFQTRGPDEAVELVCKNGSGAVGVFPPTGKGQVVDCGRALALGFKCTQGKDKGYASLTEDLRKFNQKTCTVSNAQLAGKTSKGTLLVEVACADGFKGYMIEYSTTPTVTAVGATGCAFAGGCKLPGNV